MIKLLFLLVAVLLLNAVYSAKAGVVDDIIEIFNDIGRQQVGIMSHIRWVEKSFNVTNYHKKGHQFHGKDAKDDAIIANMTLHLKEGITSYPENMYLLNNRFSRRLKSEKMLRIEYKIITGDIHKCKERNINNNCYNYVKQPSGSSYLNISLVWSNHLAIIHNPYIQTMVMNEYIKRWIHNEKSLLITIDLSKNNATNCSWWETEKFVSHKWKLFSIPKIYQGLLHVTTMLPSLVQGDTSDVVPAQLGYSTVSCNIPQYSSKPHDGQETYNTIVSKGVSNMMHIVKLGFAFLLFYFNAPKISDKVAEWSNPANRLNNYRWLPRSDIFWGSVYFVIFNVVFIAIVNPIETGLFFAIGLIPAIVSVCHNDDIHGIPSILYPGFQCRWIRAWQIIKLIVIELFIVILLALSAVAWGYIIPFLVDPVDIFFELYELITSLVIGWISFFILSYMATSLYWNRNLSPRKNITHNVIAVISNFVVVGTIAYNFFHEILLAEIAFVDNRFRNEWVNDDPFEYFLVLIGLCFSFYVTSILKRLTFPRAENQPQNNPIVPANVPAQQAVPANYHGFTEFIWSLGTLLCTLITFFGICCLVVVYVAYKMVSENSLSAKFSPRDEL